jgi:hypothetical protein
MKQEGNKNALNREVGTDGLRDWSFGMYDCLETQSLCTKDQLDRIPLLSVMHFAH